MKKAKSQNKIARKLLRNSWNRKAHLGWKIDFDEQQKDKKK